MTSPNSEYHNLDLASKHFNTTLFGSELPGTLITLHNHPRARGYFRRKAFAHRTRTEVYVDEICLCPSAHTGRSDASILSTLVHEMVHLWQFHLGTPPRRCYHDKEFAVKMEQVGLMPSDTGLFGGKKTGQSMTHYVIDGGAFDLACQALLETGWTLQWEEPTALVIAAGGTTPGFAPFSSKPTRKKYTCPQCKLGASSKHNARLVCGNCSVEMA